MTRYEELRYKALKRITGQVIPACQLCFRVESTELKLNIEHTVRYADKHTRNRKGYQLYRDIVEDRDDITRFKVLCTECHRHKSYESRDYSRPAQDTTDKTVHAFEITELKRKTPLTIKALADLAREVHRRNHE